MGQASAAGTSYARALATELQPLRDRCRKLRDR